MVLFRVKELEDSLKSLIINNLEFEETGERKGRLYASDSALCHKQGVMNSSAKITGKQDASFTFYVEIGNTIEKIVKNGLRDSLLFEEYELPNVGINLGGRVDGLILYKGKIWVLEIKSIGTLPTKPLPNHEAQAMIYSAITGFPALILYVDRKIRSFDEKLLLKTFELDNTFENRFKFLNRAVLGSLFVNNKLIPQKPDYMMKTHCNYCGWYDSCWNYSPIDLTKYDMSEWKLATNEQTIIITEEAKKITNQLLNETIVRNRRIGVLKFLETYGRDHVKTFLHGKDWSTI